MLKKLKVAFSLLVIGCFCTTATNAQSTKKHTEKFSVNEDVNIHVNTTHTNVKFETWDKNEVEITFTIEADEKVEELFKKWDFEATGNNSEINVKSNSANHFDMMDFQFDFDMKDFDIQMKDLNLEITALNLDLDIENLVSDAMLGVNLDDIPPSPFGKNTNFNGNAYRKNPTAYLEKINKKHNTQVTQSEVEQWLEDLEEWSDNIEINIDESKIEKLEGLEERMEEHEKELQESMEKWEEENGDKIREMTEKIQEKIEGMDFEKFQNFNHFDQDRSNIKKTIHIKLPKKAKLHLNVRYGEVTLAENLRNINADLNYASLSANTIKGERTDISAAFAPVFVEHWQNGHLQLNHCQDIIIKKATKIDLHAQGTDVLIGTLLSSGAIHSAYGDLEIQTLGANLKKLNLVVDYGTAVLHLPSNPMDLSYTGNLQSVLSIPNKCKIISDSKEGKRRIIKAYNKKRNSGNTLSILANYGELTIK